LKRELFTIGYAGASVDDFLRALNVAKVEFVADVREMPISRKPGFSKNTLMSELRQHGIGYGHFRSLGSPMKDRHAVRETRDYGVFFAKVRKHLERKQPAEALEEVIARTKFERVCLMCFCADWESCHRRCIVEKLKRTPLLRITHLSTRTESITLWDSAVAR
jgi:uncharacterized protein (DUF488 family)